ncbi:MAG: hypothetical protein UFM30_03830 [Bacteroidales bacterium]|nr:hypothetical protein [Bacteroidales bacterium]
MNEKKKRLDILKQLIASNTASNQEDILSMLAEKGSVVTQATLSRDLKELKVAKTPDGKGGYHYKLPEINTPDMPEQLDMRHASVGVFSIEFSGQFGVIKTRPGYANMIATIVESALKHKIMGTIAGDDTLLLLLREQADVESIMYILESALPGIKERRI